MARASTHSLAFAIAALLALPAISTAQTGGGQPAPGPSAGALPADPGFTISARRALYRGSSLRINGTVITVRTWRRPWRRRFTHTLRRLIRKWQSA